MVCIDVNDDENVFRRSCFFFRFRCLTTIGKHQGACEHLCASNNLEGIIKQVQEKWINVKDIQDEAKLLWLLIQKNAKPKAPKIDGKKRRIERRLIEIFS